MERRSFSFPPTHSSPIHPLNLSLFLSSFLHFLYCVLSIFSLIINQRRRIVIIRRENKLIFLSSLLSSLDHWAWRETHLISFSSSSLISQDFSSFLSWKTTHTLDWPSSGEEESSWPLKGKFFIHSPDCLISQHFGGYVKWSSLSQRCFSCFRTLSLLSSSSSSSLSIRKRHHLILLDTCCFRKEITSSESVWSSSLIKQLFLTSSFELCGHKTPFFVIKLRDRKIVEFLDMTPSLIPLVFANLRLCLQDFGYACHLSNSGSSLHDSVMFSLHLHDAWMEFQIPPSMRMEWHSDTCGRDYDDVCAFQLFSTTVQ